MRQSLKDVLFDARGETIADSNMIKAYVEAMGKVTLKQLYSACGYAETDDTTYNLNLVGVVISFEALADLSDEEIKRGIERITLRDFACMTDYVDERMDPELKEGLMSDLILDKLFWIVVYHLGDLISVAKDKGMKVAKNFSRIDQDILDNLLDCPRYVVRGEGEKRMLGDFMTQGSLKGVFKLCKDYDIHKAIDNFYSFATNK